MASLHYKFATMNSGKSTQLIQAHFNYLERGMVPLAMTPAIDDRFGPGIISARVGLELKVEVFSDSCDLFEMVKARHGEKPIDVFIVDEAQFLTREQVYQLARIVDELKIPVIGIVARLDPIKDHASFLEAAAGVAAAMPAARFVCVGNGEPVYTASLKTRATALGLDSRLLWAGARHDMSAVYNALDVNVLCSIGEGMPNVLGEAMACGTPCVVTDAGDSALVVGDTGPVVPVRAPRELAAAMIELAGAPPAERHARALQARQRIVERYDAHACASRLGDALASVSRQS